MYMCVGRDRTIRFPRTFSPLLDDKLHFTLPHDPQRQFRRVVYSTRPVHEYQAFRIDLPTPIAAAAGRDIVFSSRIFTSPSLVFDYGILEIDRDELRVYEIWLRRFQVYRLRPEARSLWVMVWNDGNDVPTVVRSSCELSLHSMPEQRRGDGHRMTRMLPANEIHPDESGRVVFPAGGFQIRAPYAQIEVVSLGASEEAPGSSSPE